MKRRLLVGAAILCLGAGLLFASLRQTAGPPPADIASFPMLVRGREVYFDRCQGCHGVTGVGNGPTARILDGPAPLDLTDETWKYGAQPESIMAVVRQGIPNSAMPGFGAYLSQNDLNAVTAYVLHLAGRPLPEPWAQRDPESNTDVVSPKHPPTNDPLPAGVSPYETH